MDKFKNKYRIPSARLAGYDYARHGAYFITICTHNRTSFFGDISNGVMQFTAIGEIAKSCWEQIPAYSPFITLGESVIMPNHVHGIILINIPCRTDAAKGKAPNIGKIINHYKRACTLKMRKFNPVFAWQARFYDRIIRDEEELAAVSDYILTNPVNWEKDDYF